MKNFVIFGASGDLAQNYLFPSLFHLWQKGAVFNYFGFGRTPLSDSDFRSFVLSSTQNKQFSSLFKYISGSYDASGLANLPALNPAETIFYSALPTRFDIISPLVTSLPKSSTLVIEKPFGTDYRSAKQLINLLDSNLGSEHVFLVDHYLTKELVRNLTTLRFANPVFSSSWNSQYIKEINIIASETRGIDSRGQYYDQTGAVRDMIQNHCLQLLVLTVMDQPLTYNYADFQIQKLSVLQHLELFGSPDKSIKIGQYEGYLNEPNVAPGSTTETLAQVKLKFNHPSWHGVPLNISTGKKLDQKITEINVVFKNEPKNIPNQLTINLYPDNDIILTINSSFDAKLKNPQPVKLTLGPLDPGLIAASSYENVIKDIVAGNRLNSPSFDEILASWKLVDKIITTPHLRDHLFCY